MVELGIKPLVGSQRVRLHDGNVPIFEIETLELGSHFWSFMVYEVDSWEEGAREIVCNTTLYARGSIKFDGCANLEFKAIPHFCGIQGAAQHCNLILYLYDYASKAIADADQSEFELGNG